MNHLLIGISAALGACLLVLLAVLAGLARRSGRRADERVGTVMQALETRMDELAQELAGAVARADEESRRSRFLGDIAGSIDLDDVLARTLEAAAGLAGVDAALVRLDPQEGPPIVATLGLAAEQAERQAISGPPDGRPVRSVEITYRYTEAEEEQGDALVRAGLAVPLADEAGPLGYLGVFTHEPERRFGGEDVHQLEEIAGRAAPTIENARRFREARQLADLDALSGLHNRRYFHETLARDVARAQRYGRRLALIVFDLDDFKDINDRVGHLAGDAVLAEASERMRDAIRSADVVCRVGGDEFAVIMPESGLEHADQLFARIQATISERPIGSAGRVRISAGITELKAEDDSISLFERADDALYRAKERGKGQSVKAQTS
ncbi:MAG: sensor domain-containing diguanylate cyclase [Gaiellaceae bacterium]